MSYRLPRLRQDVSFMVVGCGGTGGFVAEGLCRLLAGKRNFIELVEEIIGVAGGGKWEFAPFSAERKAQEPGDFYSDISKIRRVIESGTNDLSLGIDRSIAFLKAAGDTDKIDELVLSGGGAHIPFLKEILAEKHSVEISVHNPLEGIEYDESLFAAHGEDLDKITPLLTVGIGLALRKAGE